MSGDEGKDEMSSTIMDSSVCISISISIGRRTFSCVVCGCFEERFKDSLGILEVVVDDIDKQRVLHKPGDQLPRRRVRLVQVSPLEA
jgi:hypothetical protein